MSDFIISFDLFGEYDNFEDWDAAVEEEERRKYEKKKEKRHKEVTPEESMTFAIILCVCPVDQGRGRIQCCQFEESESRYLTPFK